MRGGWRRAHRRLALARRVQPRMRCTAIVGLLGTWLAPAATQFEPIGGACVSFDGCYAILAEFVPSLGQVPGYPSFGADVQEAPNPRTPLECIEACRHEMFPWTFYLGGPVPTTVGDGGAGYYFQGICACGVAGLNGAIEVSCSLGSDGVIEPINDGDDGKSQGWPGGVYHLYDSMIGNTACDERYAPGPAPPPLSGTSWSSGEGGAQVEVTQAAAQEPAAYNATAPAAKSSNRQMYVLVGAGAGAMLVAVFMLWALKHTLSSSAQSRRQDSGSSRDNGGGGGGGGSSNGSRPGLADNPIFDAAVFLPSETSNSALISGGGGGGDDADGAGPPPVAEAPPSFFCPITQDLMRDPVLIGDGHTYEREAIEHWLSGHSTSPMTNAPLDSRQRNMVPNHTLRSMIVDFVEKFIAENHLENQAAAAAAAAAAADGTSASASGVDNDDDDDGFLNPLSDSVPPPPEEPEQTGSTLPRDATAAGATTFDVEDGGGDAGGLATFDVEESGPSSSRARGRDGGRSRFRGRSTPAAAPPPAAPAPAPAAAASTQAAAAAAPRRPTGPYTLEEFDPELYSREEMETVRLLLSQFAGNGLTFNILAQYNVTCPRRMAEDRRRRAVFREQQMRAQADRAAAAAAAQADAEAGGGVESRQNS